MLPCTLGNWTGQVEGVAGADPGDSFKAGPVGLADGVNVPGGQGENQRLPPSFWLQQ